MMPDTTPEELVPLAEGARRLGLAHDTARKHLSAGRLQGEKRQGRWWVWVPLVPTHAGPLPDASGSVPDAMPDASEEIRRRDHIIAGLVERVKELPATIEDAPQAANSGPLRDDQSVQVALTPLARGTQGPS